MWSSSQASTRGVMDMGRMEAGPSHFPKRPAPRNSSSHSYHLEAWKSCMLAAYDSKRNELPPPASGDCMRVGLDQELARRPGMDGLLCWPYVLALLVLEVTTGEGLGILPLFPF